MKTVQEKFDTAVWHTNCSTIQNQIFRNWSKGKTQHKQMLAFDTETTGLYWGVPVVMDYIGGVEPNSDRCKGLKTDPGPRVFGISAALEIDSIVHLFWGRLTTPLYAQLVKLIGQQGPKVAHNARYDLRVCIESRIEVAPLVDCTYTMSRIYWDRRREHSLQALTEMLWPQLSDWENVLKNELKKIKSKFTRAGYEKDFVNYSFIPDELTSKYSMQDVFCTLMLWQHLNSLICGNKV